MHEFKIIAYAQTEHDTRSTASSVITLKVRTKSITPRAMALRIDSRGEYALRDPRVEVLERNGAGRLAIGHGVAVEYASGLLRDFSAFPKGGGR